MSVVKILEGLLIWITIVRPLLQPKLDSSNINYIIMLLWKIYSWVFLLINLFSAVVMLLTYGIGFDVNTYSSIITSLALSFITIMYAYGKKIEVSFVKTIFWVNLLFLALNVMFRTSVLSNTSIGMAESGTGISFADLFLAYGISMPALYACYKLTWTGRKG